MTGAGNYRVLDEASHAEVRHILRIDAFQVSVDWNICSVAATNERVRRR